MANFSEKIVFILGSAGCIGRLIKFQPCLNSIVGRACIFILYTFILVKLLVVLCPALFISFIESFNQSPNEPEAVLSGSMESRSI